MRRDEQGAGAFMVYEPVTVSFDLDGVVMQNPFERGVEPFVWEHIRQAPSLQALDPAEAHRLVREAIHSCWNQRMANGEFVSAFNWDIIFNEVSQDFEGQPVPDVAGLVNHFCRVEDTIACLPGVPKGLERLQAAGVRLIALTNGYHPYQWPVLQSLKLDHLFDAVVTPEVVGYAKPDPRIFHSIPALFAHVGDTLVHDVVGANLASVRSIWLNPLVPEELRGEYTEAEDLKPYLEEVIATDPRSRYHPEANLETCMPNAVVADVNEAAEILLGWLETAMTEL